MSHQKILEKALLKAHKNGWEPLSTIPWKNVSIEQWQGNEMVGIALLYVDRKGSFDTTVHWVRELEGIIFNHDFAKAIFGEEAIPTSTLKTVTINDFKLPSWTSKSTTPAWQYHLQQMVIDPNPIEYLGENI